MSKMRLMILSTLAVSAVSALSVASASAQEPAPHYFYCAQKGGSTWLYENNSCGKDTPGAGSWELVELPLSIRLEVTSKVVAGTKFTGSSEALGVKVEVACSEETSSGWVENPAGGDPGIGLGTGSFSECEVKKPTGCTVAQPIVATAKTELGELEGAFWNLFTPDSGTTMTEVEFKNCGLVDQKFKMTGKTAGKIHNETGIVSFNQEMNELKFAGNKVGFEGESLFLTTGGGTIQVFLTTD
jgi:hypothetical protein